MWQILLSKDWDQPSFIPYIQTHVLFLFLCMEIVWMPYAFFLSCTFTTERKKIHEWLTLQALVSALFLHKRKSQVKVPWVCDLLWISFHFLLACSSVTPTLFLTTPQLGLLALSSFICVNFSSISGVHCTSSATSATASWWTFRLLPPGWQAGGAWSDWPGTGDLCTARAASLSHSSSIGALKSASGRGKPSCWRNPRAKAGVSW